MSFSFNLDEQIFLRNDQTNKVYTLTLNRNKNPTTYDVTREWTVPNQQQLASKTDRFPIFKQAAEQMEKLYTERIENGYIEIMRRQGIIKSATKIDIHKWTETINPIRADIVTGKSPGKQLEQAVQSRQRTGIFDRIDAFKRK